MSLTEQRILLVKCAEVTIVSMYENVGRTHLAVECPGSVQDRARSCDREMNRIRLRRHRKKKCPTSASFLHTKSKNCQRVQQF